MFQQPVWYTFSESKWAVSCQLIGHKLWLFIWLVNQVAVLLVICQLSCDVIGYIPTMATLTPNLHRGKLNNCIQSKRPEKNTEKISNFEQRIPIKILFHHPPSPTCRSFSNFVMRSFPTIGCWNNRLIPFPFKQPRYYYERNLFHDSVKRKMLCCKATSWSSETTGHPLFHILRGKICSCRYFTIVVGLAIIAVIV